MSIIKDTTDADGIRNVTIQTTATGTDNDGYKAAERQAVKIWIEGAECLVPRKGTQESRLQIQEEAGSQPTLAEDIKRCPGYVDPAGQNGGDEWAMFNWEWMGEDMVVNCWRSFLPIEALPLIKEQTVGNVHRHADRDDWIEYSFSLKASYALSVLASAGMIPANSVLMNDIDEPLSYDEELEAAR